MNKTQYFVIFSCIILASMFPSPQIFQRRPRVDGVSAADINLNTVASVEDKAKILPASEIIAPQRTAFSLEQTTVRTLSQTTEPPLVYPKPLEPGMFARFITDIFQIPISVLQSVTRLLTNPFLGQSKE